MSAFGYPCIHAWGGKGLPFFGVVRQGINLSIPELFPYWEAVFGGNGSLLTGFPGNVRLDSVIRRHFLQALDKASVGKNLDTP